MSRALVHPLLVLLLPAFAGAATWHIQPDGTGDAPTIQAGIDSAAAGDTVELACGVYGERNIHMKSGVCLRSETGDPACATIDAHGVGRVLICEIVDDNATIEGLTITGGHAVGSHPDHHGGGLYLHGSSPKILNCVFMENQADWLGGGLFCFFSSPYVEACEFRSNASLRGGGVGVFQSSPRFVQCAFKENTASDFGGGVATGEDSYGSFLRCQFLDNQALNYGGGVHTYDAAVGFLECEIRGNSTQGEGGGMYVVQCDGPRSRIIDCVVAENHATESGGVRIDRSTTVVQDCEISGNEALEIGGGIHFHENADALIERCVIFGNRASYGGGVVAELISDPIIRNCTVYGNEGTIAAGGLYAYRGSEPTLINTIVAHSKEGEAVTCVNQSTATLICSDIYGNVGGDYVGCIREQYGVNGNFSADPLFCDAPLGDFTLAATSPCLPGHHPDGDDCDLVGALGEGCAGGTAVEQTSWGGIKSLFR